MVSNNTMFDTVVWEWRATGAPGCTSRTGGCRWECGFMKGMYRKAVGIPTFLAFLLMVAVGSALPAGAQEGPPADGVELTVRAFFCPSGFDGTGSYDECVMPAEGVAVSISRNGSFLTEDDLGADGSVFFGDLAAGSYSIELEVEGDIPESGTSCTAPNANEALTIEGAGTNRIGIELGDGAQPTCTFYVVSENDLVQQLVAVLVAILRNILGE